MVQATIPKISLPCHSFASFPPSSPRGVADILLSNSCRATSDQMQYFQLVERMLLELLVRIELEHLLWQMHSFRAAAACKSLTSRNNTVGHLLWLLWREVRIPDEGVVDQFDFEVRRSGSL